MPNTFAYGLDTSESVMQVAKELIKHLDNELRPDDKHWTYENFRALDSFPVQGALLKRFHGVNGSEFLWDYIASDDQQGIFLVAESEKATRTSDAETFPLKHDFEKLLYVFSPLRLMLCKAIDDVDAKRIADLLMDYAQGCCSNFSPGSVFILYCRIECNERVCYTWQAPGEPSPMSNECIKFERC